MYKKHRSLNLIESDSDYVEDDFNADDQRLEKFMEKFGFDPDKDIEEYDQPDEPKTYYNKEKRAYEKKAIQEIK